MKKVIILSFVVFANSVFACDMCGCFLGIVPYDNQSSISFLHRYRAFNGYRNYQHHSKMFASGAYKTMHGSEPHDSVARNYSSADYESYKVYELRAKFYFHKRWEINAIAGISNNKSKEDSVIVNHTGFNDPSFYVAYHLIQPSLEKNWKHRLILAGGVKIPSGNYYARNSEGARLPFLMQPGTGSVDYFAFVNYVVGIKNFGLSTTNNFKVNGTNYYKERVGNSYTNFTNFFYKIPIKKVVLIPSVNSYYEFTKGLYVNNQLTKATSMNELMLGIGTDCFYKNIGLNLAFQRTIYQQVQQGNLKSAGRLVIGLTYNFNQRKYLINKKE